ncbi:flagellar assembly peptidoglycan hydrolase FlgJ [Advenella sp. RU8]|uniref:flagellar assembly peptidoglycan hydrolase FlgJ n=1 Tax=Advenella sp. RU8 TaxID=3399575 RepID=UPI003AB09C23
MTITSYTPRPGVGRSAPQFVMDINSLHQLKRQVAGQMNTTLEEIEKGEKEVAQQFEALFIQTLMKQARSTRLGDGLFESDQTRLVQSMADEQMALHLASGKGIGLAESLLAQIRSSGSAAMANAGVAAGAGSASAVMNATSAPGSSSLENRDAIGELISSLGNRVRNFAKNMASVIDAVDDAPERVSSFVDKMGPAASAAAASSGIPASLILSQAALESGWGRREILHENGQTSYNLFGIKATGGWTGKVVNVMTTEYVDGVAKKMKQAFRAYDSYEESFADYARLISQNERYQDVLTAENAHEAAREIQKAGYATDPKYASKLINIMGYFDERSLAGNTASTVKNRIASI